MCHNDGLSQATGSGHASVPVPDQCDLLQVPEVSENLGAMMLGMRFRGAVYGQIETLAGLAAPLQPRGQIDLLHHLP